MAVRVEDRLAQLMGEHERSLFTYMLALAHDRDVANDCTQDAFVRAYDMLRSGKDVNLQWLYKVARNRVMDEFRHRRKVRADAEQVERKTVEEAIDRRLIIQQVMQHLPSLDRDVLYLFAILGFKTDEIAGMLGTSGAAIRQRLYRARFQFRALYAAEA